jgi:hypothetical protein
MFTDVAFAHFLRIDLDVFHLSCSCGISAGFVFNTLGLISRDKLRKRFKRSGFFLSRSFDVGLKFLVVSSLGLRSRSFAGLEMITGCRRC